MVQVVTGKGTLSLAINSQPANIKQRVKLINKAGAKHATHTHTDTDSVPPLMNGLMRAPTSTTASESEIC